jgi:hypothetical protein
MTAQTKSTLPRSSQRLIELMSAISFGRIEGLAVRNGQPVLDPPPRIIRERLLGSAGKSSCSPPPADDFLIRSQVSELFSTLAQIGNGVVQALEIRHGLPFRLTTVEHGSGLEGGSA